MEDYTLSNLLEIQFLLDFGKGKVLGHSRVRLPFFLWCSSRGWTTPVTPAWLEDCSPVEAPCLELPAGGRGTGVGQAAAVGGVGVDGVGGGEGVAVGAGGGVRSGSAAADELAFADVLAFACATGGRSLAPEPQWLGSFLSKH